MLLGHFDTVWPLGTLAELPWSVTDNIATGPGVFDMKAGIVQLFHALASLPSLDGVVVLLNSDEEIGSPTSRALIEEQARQVDAVLVLEAAADGAVSEPPPPSPPAPARMRTTTDCSSSRCSQSCPASNGRGSPASRC